MFAITADQRDSRHAADLVPQAIRRLRARHDSKLLLPPDQNAGDEIQMLTASPTTVLNIVLELTREGDWSVGMGVGTVDDPLPTATRMVRGTALLAAREAVDRAKRHPTRFALNSAHSPEKAHDVGAMIGLLIALRDKRTDQGWAVHDALAEGLNQKDAATKLDVTPQAVSARIAAGAIRVEREAHQPLIRMLTELNASDR